MRKIKTGIFLVIFTTAAVLMGFALPELTADYQEKHRMAQVDVYGSEDARFPTTYHLLDCMKLMAYGYEEVDLESGKVHSPEEISEICQNTLGYLAENFLVQSDSQICNEKKRVFLAVKKEKGTKSESDSTATSGSGNKISDKSEKDKDRNSDSKKSYASVGSSASQEIYEEIVSQKSAEYGSVIVDISEFGIDNEPQTISAIIWECTVQDQYGNEVTFWIDDLSGKMISFQCVYDMMYLEEMGYGFYLDIIYNMDLMDYFKEYYGFSEVYPIFEYMDSILLAFTDKSGEQAAVYISQSFDSNSIYFNPH